MQRRDASYVTRRYQRVYTLTYIVFGAITTPVLSPTQNCTNMLQHQEWQTVEQRRIATNLTMLYKISNNIVTVPTHTYLTPWTRPTHIHITSATCHTNVTQMLSNIATLHAPSFYGIRCHLTRYLHPPLTCSRTQCCTPPQQLQSNTAHMHISTFTFTLLFGTSLYHHCGGGAF